MSRPELVSVIITTYNRSDALLAVLAGLVRQTDQRFEVVVADDGSRIEHQQAILTSPLARQLRLRHVWHPDVGFTASKARNRAVASSHGDYLIFLDGDCIPELDFIARHRHLSAPACFVNGSRVLLSQPLTQRVLEGREQVFGRSWGFWIGLWCSGQASKLTSKIRLPDWPGRIQTEFSWKGIRSCNMAVWRQDFEAVQGFDESFVGWGHEDADFVLRLHHHGLSRKNGFCHTEVYHLWHQEATRQHESHNAGIVRERIQSGARLPMAGYRLNRPNDDAVVTSLG